MRGVTGAEAADGGGIRSAAVAGDEVAENKRIDSSCEVDILGREGGTKDVLPGAKEGLHAASWGTNQGLVNVKQEQGIWHGRRVWCWRCCCGSRGGEGDDVQRVGA